MQAQVRRSLARKQAATRAGGARAPDLRKMRQRAGEAARFLKALSNAQRLRILCLLASGERTVTEINAQVPGLSQSALSQHLAKLRNENLVHARRQAQTIHYSLTPGPVERIMTALYEIYCTPNKRHE